MKKLFILSCVMLLTCFAFGQKFGYINSGELLMQLPDVKAADSDIDQFHQLKIKQGQAMAQDLQAAAQLLDQEYNVEGKISAKEYQDRGAALQKKQEEIQVFEQDLYKALAEKKEVLYKPILDKINTAIEDVSKENGFTMIFDSNTGVLLFAEEALNVTELVKAKLGVPAGTPSPAAPKE